MTFYSDVVWPDIWRANSGGGSTIQAGLLQINLPNRQRFVVQRYEEGFRELRMSLIQDITDADMQQAINILNIVIPGSHTFLAKDWSDWNSTDNRMEDGDESLINFTDQPMRNTVTGLFTGDGSTRTFYVGKRYLIGSGSEFKRVRQPDSGTLRIGVDGTELFESDSPDGWTLGSNGLVTLDQAPGNGLNVTAGFEYKLPVYVARDQATISTPIKYIREIRSIVLREELIAD